MKSSKKKNVKKSKSFLTIFLCLIINCFVIYYVGGIFYDVYEKVKEKDSLTHELDNLKDEGEALKIEVTKLSDKEYIAKYAREKYLYSGNDEYIIRIK